MGHRFQVRAETLCHYQDICAIRRRRISATYRPFDPEEYMFLSILNTLLHNIMPKNGISRGILRNLEHMHGLPSDRYPSITRALDKDLSSDTKHSLRRCADKEALDSEAAITELTHYGSKQYGWVCDYEGRFTRVGKVYAISLCNLYRQCEILSVPINELEIEKRNRGVEFDVKEYYEERGYIVSYCEGGVFQILFYSLILEALLRVIEKHENVLMNNKEIYLSVLYSCYFGSTLYEDLLIWYPELPELLLDSINKCSEDQLLKSYDKISEAQKEGKVLEHDWRNKAVTVNREFILNTYRALSKDELNAFAKQFIDSHGYFGLGTLDLVCIKNNEISMREVKTNDKLTFGQIIAIDDIHDDFKFPVAVDKVSRI